MLFTDLEYFLRKNLRKVKGKFLRAQQRGVFSRQRVGRCLGVFLLSSFILGLNPEMKPAARPGGSVQPPPAVVAGTEKNESPPALASLSSATAAGTVKGESTFKQLSEKNVRGPERIPDSPDFGEITAKAALFVEVNSGTLLWGKEPQQVLPLASTTKMMTALVAVSLFPLTETVTVPGACVSLAGTQQMGLQAGEKISAESLLTGMLVASAGDAACALAQHQGGRGEFIGRMNEKARGLGMAQTHFTNPLGNDELNGNGNEGTAVDLLLLAREFWQNNSLREVVGLSEETVASVDGRTVHELRTTNELLDGTTGVRGIKTGYTAKAKGCFVSFYDKGGRQILGVVLGSDDRFGETQKILDWILAVYRWPS